MASRYNILERMKERDIPSKMVIKKIAEKGVECSPAAFSKAVNGKSYSDKSETIACLADTIVSELEARI